MASSDTENLYQQRLEALKENAREEEQEESSAEGDVQKVSPLDGDFILILLFAVFVDILDILTEFGIIVAGVPKIIGIGLDIITFAIISFWIYARTKKIIQSKNQQAEALGKQVTKISKSSIIKSFGKKLLPLAGEIIPFVGLFPFWTITVFDVLKEKGE